MTDRLDLIETWLTDLPHHPQRDTQLALKAPQHIASLLTELRETRRLGDQLADAATAWCSNCAACDTICGPQRQALAAWRNHTGQ